MKTESDNKLDEKLSEALSRAVLSETESSFADRDAFQNWLDEGAQRQNLNRRRKIRRAGLAAAAVFLCAILLTGSLLLSDALPPSLKALLSPEEGVAVPGFNSNVESGNGNVVIGGDGNGNTGTWSATFASYDEIPEKYREQIIWFEEMPEGYELETINVKQNNTNVSFILKYQGENNSVIVIKQMESETDIPDVKILCEFDVEMKIGDYKVYKKTADNVETFSYVVDDSFISLICFNCGNQNKTEAMIASVKTGLNK